MKNTTKGFTLLEMVIAIGISSLIMLFLTRLFSVSLKSYNLQEQLADMNQNAKFTIKELSDLLMQAGADMQLVSSDTLDRDTIIIQDGNKLTSNGFTIKINPRGGFFQIPQSITSPVCSIQVNDASTFRLANKMEKIPGIKSSLPVKTYSLIRYDSISNFIVFSPADIFSEGDAIASYNRSHYYLKGTSLCLDNDTNVIAENIDSLAITFLDINKDPVLSWKSMWSVQLYVRARTLLPDMKYNGYPDHYRRMTLTHEIRLRNRVGSDNL
jgi:prepilin-type N-terminal cleavage/methylation domain-containing protein